MTSRADINFFSHTDPNITTPPLGPLTRGRSPPPRARCASTSLIWVINSKRTVDYLEALPRRRAFMLLDCVPSR